MRNPKVYLFSAPISLTPAPLLGVPVLQGYLSNNGIECSSADLNIRFLQWLLKDRTLLDEFASDVIKGYEQIQQSEVLTKQGIMDFMQKIAALSLMPPEITEKHFGSKAVIGVTEQASLGSWGDHMPCWTTALVMLGLDPHDLGRGISEAKAFENRHTAFDAFLDTVEAKDILQSAASCDVVGISTPFWLQQNEYAFRIAKEIKKINPKAFVIFGGGGVTIMAKYCLDEIKNSGVVDAIGLYQGELTLRLLAECIVKGEKLEKIPDLILFNHKEKNHIYTDHMPTIHPDLLPTPVFNHEELEMYYKISGKLLSDRRAPLIISRGCYWDKCAFCADSQCRHPDTSPHEARDSEKVLDDIEQLQKLHGISYFYLITSAMSPSWGKKFAKGILQRGIKARFWTYTRAMGEAAADSEYFQLLKEAGFDVITCGVESTVDRVLDAISKGNGRAEITNTIHGLSNAGIRTKFNLIADIPPSTYEDAKSNWDYIIENLPYINDLSVYTFLLHMGSEMADNPEKFNITVGTKLDGSKIELYPGILAHKNPFYENNRVYEIIQRTKNISKDIQFFQLTKSVRNTIDNKDFSWRGSTIQFWPFIAISSKFAPFEVNQRDCYIVFLSDMFNYFVVPSAFTSFLEIYKQGVREPVPFEKLLQVFEAGMAAYDLQNKGIGSEQLIIKMLDKMARSGFVLDVQATQGQFQNMKTEWFNFQENFPRVSGRYTIADRPFTFGTFPFAMVLSTLML